VTAINITGKPNGPHRSRRVNTSPANGQKKTSFTEAMSKAEALSENSVQSVRKKWSAANAERLFSRQTADDEAKVDDTDSKFSSSLEIKERQLENGEVKTSKENVATAETNSLDSLAGKDLKQAPATAVHSASRGSTHRIEKLQELSALIDRLPSTTDSNTNQWTVKVLNKMSGVNEITLIRSVMQGWTIDINLRAGALGTMQSHDLQALRTTLQKRGHKVNEIAARHDDREQTS